MIKIFHANSPKKLEQVRDLFLGFVSWYRSNYPDDRDFIENYLDNRSFSEEVSSLPGRLCTPGRKASIAYYNGKPAGCAALKEKNLGTCELKRLFVSPLFRNRGVGRALADAAIREARMIGYSSILVSSTIQETEAQGLFKTLGFKDTAAGEEVPEDIRKWLVFMKMELKKE